MDRANDTTDDKYNTHSVDIALSMPPRSIISWESRSFMTLFIKAPARTMHAACSRGIGSVISLIMVRQNSEVREAVLIPVKVCSVTCGSYFLLLE